MAHMVHLVAPEGYKLRDKRNGNLYSEIIIWESNRGKYELVPDTTEPTTNEEIYGG